MLYRTFTTREKVLFIFFGILLVGAVYYFVVFKPVTEQKTIVQNTIYTQQEEADMLLIKFSEMNKMKAELKELPSENDIKPLPEYDNVRNVMEYLNSVMAFADDYSISFASVSTEETFVRRTLSISFSSASSEVARNIIDLLFDAPFRSQVKDFNISYADRGGTSVNMTVVFFEKQKDAA